MPPEKLKEIFLKKMQNAGLLGPDNVLGPVAVLLCDAIEEHLEQRQAWRETLEYEARGGAAG